MSPIRSHEYNTDVSPLLNYISLFFFFFLVLHTQTASWLLTLCDFSFCLTRSQSFLCLCNWETSHRHRLQLQLCPSFPWGEGRSSAFRSWRLTMRCLHRLTSHFFLVLQGEGSHYFGLCASVPSYLHLRTAQEEPGVMEDSILICCFLSLM